MIPQLLPLVAEALTPREQDVAKLLFRGLGNVEMAKVLGISDQTVKVVMRRLGYKAGITGRLSRLELAMRLAGIR
jgi:DNA-binding NarL/FixJ family response regulator